MNDIPTTITKFIAENLPDPAAPITVAFSGGADSCALLDILCRLSKSGEIQCDIFAAHINHNLRAEESDADEAFARNFAGERNIPIRCESVDVNGYAAANNVSTETAARELRLSAICSIARQFGSRTIATAHHKNDNAETMIHRLSRGTGLKGLGGIWPRRTLHVDGTTVDIIRPLLCIDRPQVERYCRDNNIQWRHDSSNDELIYTRNVIRHDILPALETDARGSISDKLYSLSASARRLYKKIDALAADTWNESVSIAEDDTVVIDAASFNARPGVVRQELIRKAYCRLGGSELKINAAHYENIIEFAGENESGKLQLPGDIYCFRGYGRIIFTKIQEHGIAYTIIDSPGSFRFRDWTISVERAPFLAERFKSFLQHKQPTEEWFDAATLTLPICVRSRETGDKFRPIGQRSHKRVGKFLIGARLNHAQRAKMIVFEDAAKNIIWIAPHRSSDITKITENTKEVYRIKISKTDNEDKG